MSLERLVYASRPFGFDSATLSAILFEARNLNARNGVTGALICRADLYLQLLEGPARAVMSTYGRILRDDRHVEVRELLRGPAESRIFPGWAMLDDPARSWVWSRQEVEAGALDRASPEEILAAFARIADATGAEPG
jgi:hypothetical protein